jgi:tol-pal system protein YbgF
MKRYSAAPLALLLLLPVASPAAAQNREHQQMEAELRMVQEQNQQLAVALQQAMEALKAVNGRIDAAMEAMRKGFADQGLATKNMAGDVSTIAERSRDTDTRLRTLSDEIAALQATFTAVASSLAQGGGAPIAPLDPNAPPTPVPTATSPATSTPSAINTVGLSPGRMLEQAKGDYYRGQWALAITGFEQLIKQFANTEAAGEAQYWIGESQFQQKNWAEAIAAYSLVLQKSPRASYAADAAYKRGEAQRQAGDVPAARASYEQAIRQYPNTDAANLAQQRLDGLPKTGTTPARP